MITCDSCKKRIPENSTSSVGIGARFQTSGLAPKTIVTGATDAFMFCDMSCASTFDFTDPIISAIKLAIVEAAANPPKEVKNGKEEGRDIEA